MAEKTFRNDLTQGGVAEKLIKFAMPLFASNALQAIYSIVDMVVVGQVIGKDGMAGVAIGGDILMFLSAISMGFSGAGQVIIAQNLGAKRLDDVKKIIGTMFTFLLSVSLVLTVICYFLKDKMLIWMDTPQSSYEEAYMYTLTCIFGLFFTYGYNMVSAIMRGLGDSKRPFIFVAIAAILNAILDVIFVKFLGMRSFGAAFATVIGQAVSFIFAIVYLYRHKEAFGFDFKPESFKISKIHLKTLVSLGVPMAIQTAAISFSRIVVATWVNGFGATAAAVAGIYNKACHIVALFANAFSTAGGAMIGQNIGAEMYDRVKKIYRTLFIMMFGVAVCLVALVNLFPTQIFALFTSDADVIETAHLLILPISLFALGASGRTPGFALINGSGYSKLNLVIALLDGIVCRLSFCYIFTFVLELGARGCWVGDGAASFVPMVVGAIYLASGKWKTNKYLVKRQIK